MAKYFYLFLLFIPHLLLSQEVIWANKIIEKSSEVADESFSPKNKAIQILGKPNVLPQTISSPCSWHPAGSGFGEDYIKVGFEKAIKIKQIIVGETVHPGAIARIFGYTKEKTEVLLYENKDPAPKLSGRTWNIIIPETANEIYAIKLLIVHSINKGFKEYDAIGISNSESPFVAKINLAPNLPKDLARENIGENINSKFGEVAPLVSPNNKFMYFTRLSHPENIKEKSKKSEKLENIGQDVWFSKLEKNGQWGKAENIGEPINNTFDNAAATLSADGKSLYVLNIYLPNGKIVAGLSKAELKGKKWEIPKQVRIEEFQALEVMNEKTKFLKTVTEYAISTDEKYLVMGLRRTESFGDKDLYVSFKLGENQYSKPINLGPLLNSAGNEGSPFLAADNKTLYFSSNGHPGYGEEDIFVTTRLDDSWKNWSEPINLGPVINSPEWDGYITIPASGEYAYFSSSKNSMGSDDIFKVKLFPSIKPQVVNLFEIAFKDIKSAKVLRPKLELKLKQQKVDTTQLLKDIVVKFDEESQNFKTIVEVGQYYQLTATLEGYQDFKTTIDLSKETKYKEPKLTYNLSSIISPSDVKAIEKPADSKNEHKDIVLETGKKMILNSLFFDQGKAEIKKESFELLDKIKAIMTENPIMEVLLEGHTDNQGDMLLNVKLAEERVKAVKTYLTTNSTVNANRISIKSWGAMRPLIKNSSEDAMKKNRRVEFTILKM